MESNYKNVVDFVNFLVSNGIPRGIARRCLNRNLMAHTGQLEPDIFALDDFFHLKYGDYEGRGCCLNDVFKKVFKGDQYEKALEWFDLKSNDITRKSHTFYDKGDERV